MTKTGIASVVFIILGGAVGVFLLAKTIKARESRMKAVDSRFEQLEQLEKDVIEARNVVANAEQEVLGVDLQWGNVWFPTGQTQVVNPQRGLIEFGIGASAGLGNAAGGPQPTVYVFGEDGSGEGRYLGEFKITAASPTAATGMLTRPPLPGETEGWIADQYRVRTSVPSSYPSLVDDLITQYVIAEQDLQEERQRLVRAQKQLGESQAVLAERESELSGAADAAEDAGMVARNGLVESIERATNRRDSLLASVDRLRREYRRKSAELNRLLDRVRSLSGDLPSSGNAGTAGLPAAPQ